MGGSTGLQINPRSLLIAQLTEDDLPYLVDFDCGDEEMNKFLREECYQEQELGCNSTTLLFYNGQLAAFVSICADKINLEDYEESGLPRKAVPAIKVARLGRAVEFREYGFGKIMLDHALNTAFDLYSLIGARFVTLDAYPPRVPYYRACGFIENPVPKGARPRDTVSMRRDIFLPLISDTEGTG
jgi:ribosomal protein S18 acetylase RimI-like enzyme